MRLTAVFPLLLVAPSAACAQGIVGTGFLPGADHTELIALSGDGHVAVGAATAGGLGRAYWWSPGGALHEIGPGAAVAVSLDGSTIAGFDSAGVAFRWSASEGMRSLGTLPGWNWSAARGMAGHGAVIVGGSSVSATSETSAISHAFLWTPTDGMIDLGTLPGRNSSSAFGVSADGTVIVGSSWVTPVQGSPWQYRAFRWTASGGLQSLTDLGGETWANAVNADGSVVVGSATLSGGATHAVRWTTAGIQDLGVLPGETYSAASAVSADGTVIVGSSVAGGQSRAVLWTPQSGLVDLNAYLPSVGVPLGPWTLAYASAISADGRIIAGVGKRSANWEGWLVTIPAFCYANCDGSSGSPTLNILDFTCFLNRFAAGDPYANCDASTQPPTLNVLDFGCFLNQFVAGCP